MENKKELALIDFCGTVVSKDTADFYVYSYLKKRKKFIKIFLYILIKFLNISFLYSLFINRKISKKELFLLLIKGESKKNLERFAKIYSKNLRDYEIEIMNRKIKYHLNSNHKIIILSAGYSIYIKEYFKNLPILVVANEFKYNNNKFTGTLQKSDCIKKQKVVRLKEKLDFNNFYIYSYSDSKYDVPMLEIANEKNVITTKNNLPWASELGANILSYKKYN